MSNQLIFHHIRNATAKLTYSGLKILVDPYLLHKDIIQDLIYARHWKEKKQESH